MAPLFRLLALCLLLNLSLPAAIAGQVSKDDLDAQKELLQLKIDSGKESAQKDVEALGKRIEAVDKRVEDQINRFSDLGFFSGVLATLITLILGGLGMLGYLSVASRARETSEEVAGKTAERWFADNQRDLQAQIAQIQSTAQQAHAEIEILRRETQSHYQEMAELRVQMQAAKAELDELRDLTNKGKQAAHNCKTMADAQMAAMQRNMGTLVAGQSERPTDQATTASPELERYVAELEKASDRKKDFDYWNAQAFVAYAKNDLAVAIEHWLQAAAMETTSPLLAAQALHNTGVALWQQEKQEEALKIYEKLIAQYGTDTHPKMRKHVARAMFNKGFILRQQNQPGQALKIWEEVIAQYSADSLQETREQVAYAINGKAFGLLLSAKDLLAANPAALVQTTLNEAQALLQQALERKPNWGLALGNLAYVQWLLQQPAAAETSYRQALQANEDGSEALHRATLDDIEQHPIPADQGFRELVDRLWAEYQSQVPGQATG